MDRNEQLLGVATRWCAKLSAPDCSAAERAEFSRWLEDDHNRAAFEQVRRAEMRVGLAIDCDERFRELAERAYAAGARVQDERASSRRTSRRARPHRWAYRARATIARSRRPATW